MLGRIPISFYLNILAGIVVLFNHYAASETGDIALNKVTGAAGRFYIVFRDTAVTFQHGCYSHLETALCGPTINSILPHDTAEYFRLRYCHGSSQNSGSVSTGGMPSDRRPHGGYGGSDVAFLYYKSPSPFVLNWSKRCFFAQGIWEGCYEAMEVTAALFFRACASWWWFRAPVGVTGILLAVHAAMSTIGYLFGPNEVVQLISQAYMAIAVDFLRCMEWEAQCHILDIAVSVMDDVYGTLVACS
ncbi:hypothetical protein JVU11DRAFT_7381 [Chiua virens]|nr:hypothetical protein JVU11DRAFT_7381 [Chiua virens]